MHFLLVNNNPAVSRLINLSVEKLGFKIDETVSFEELQLESYDVVFVDSALYNELTIDEHISSGLSRYFVAILPRGEDKPSNINYVLEKPFLPTDFIELVSRIDSEISDENLNTNDEEILGSDDIKSSEDIEDTDLKKDKDLEDLYNMEVENLSTLDLEEDSESDSDNEKEDLDIDDEKEFEEDDNLLDEDTVKDIIKEDDDEEEFDSILNSEDIDEVKHLLEDNDDLTNDESLNLDILKEELNLEEKEDLSLEEPEELENLDIETLDEDVSDLEEKIESIKLEDDLNLEVDSTDKINIETLEDDLKETSVDELEIEFDTLIQKSDSEDTVASSIEDIKEEDLLKVLSSEDLDTCKEKDMDENINIEEEIQKKVSKSVKEALESSSIRDALKGMKVNVSISFEEDK